MFGTDRGDDLSRQASGPPQAMSMGTNLDGLAYWNTGLPTLDVMKSAGSWLPQTDTEYDTGERVVLDRHGWVAAIPGAGDRRRHRSVLVNVLHDNPAAEPGARYVVLYDGDGGIEMAGGAELLARRPGRLVVKAAANGGLYLRLTSGVSPDATPPRNIRIVREHLLPLYEAGLTFNPAYLSLVGEFHVVRFMDWMNTNLLLGRDGRRIEGEAAIEMAPLLSWADRPLPTDMRWGDGSRGVPVEAMVEFANRIGAAPWFNMPVNASDEYLRGFATYVRDHLRPGLKVHVELSNEVWNAIFPQARYAKARAVARWGEAAHPLEWYGMRAAEMGVIWRQVFGERPGSPGRRVSVVFGTQFGWKGLEKHGLETPRRLTMSNERVDAAKHFDEYAIAAYYDGAMNTDGSVPIVRRWRREPDGGFAIAIAALRARILDHNRPLYRYHGDQARAYGLALVTYESGYGETTPPSQHADTGYTDFLTAVQRHRDLFALDTLNFRALKAEGAALFMNFGIVSSPGKWGSWSALERIDQASSPRYRALRAWLAANPPDAAGLGPVAAFADGRIATAAPSGGVLAGTPHGHDLLVGGAGVDLFAPKGGGTRVAGAGGNDVLLLAGTRARYRITERPGGLVSIAGREGVHHVSGVPRVRFGDGAAEPLAAETRGVVTGR